MTKGLDKGAAQLRIEGQCREMNPGGAYAELAADLGFKAELEVYPTCRGCGSDGGRQHPDGQYEAFKCEACDGFGTAQGCTLCGSNDHSTTGCPMRSQAAPRQPEGDGLEVVGYARDSELAQLLDPTMPTGKHVRVGLDHPTCWLDDTPYEHLVALCSMADAQRAIVERDATITRLEAGIPRIQEQSHQMRQERDRLAGLLREVLPYANYCEDNGRLFRGIQAALAEVNK